MCSLKNVSRLFVITLCLASWVKAHPIPETVPGQIAKVIVQLPLDKFRFSFDQQNNSSETFISICALGDGLYGLVPDNISNALCWFCDGDTGSLKSTDKYESVLETETELNSQINVFLEHQPDPNKGIWTSRQKSVCYTPGDMQRTRSYCLQSNSVAITGEPTSSGRNSGGEAGGYIALGAVILIVVGIIVFAECRMKCITNSCVEYCAM